MYYADSGEEPKNVQEALDSSNAQQWKEAMIVEHEALMKSRTWDFNDPLEGRKAIDCKWIFKQKLK